MLYVYIYMYVYLFALSLFAFFCHQIVAYYTILCSVVYVA